MLPREHDYASYSRTIMERDSQGGISSQAAAPRPAAPHQDTITTTTKRILSRSIHCTTLFFVLLLPFFKEIESHSYNKAFGCRQSLLNDVNRRDGKGPSTGSITEALRFGWKQAHRRHSSPVSLLVKHDAPISKEEQAEDSSTTTIPALLRFQKPQSFGFGRCSDKQRHRDHAIEYPFHSAQNDEYGIDEQEEDELSYLEAHFASSKTEKEQSKQCLFVNRKHTSEPVRHDSSIVPAGGAATATRPLVFWETMVCGAISRSVAQTIMHPANTMKTILQRDRSSTFQSLARPSQLPRLFVGAGANFLLSVPHGAVNFAVLEFVRKRLDTWADRRNWDTSSLGPALDFMSSAISTITCSVVSTPQMMITDNIMAGNYPSLVGAVKGLARDRGIAGFYSGWWPGLVGKIPSYALTWTFFQQFKVAHRQLTKRQPRNYENSIMGCLSSAITVTIMIPMDTIKTRLVTQGSDKVYKGIVDCAIKIAKEEGMSAFYRGLPPRLISVVPMIGIQFGVYEFMKKVMMKRQSKTPPKTLLEEFSDAEVFRMSAMEVAASPEHPYPAPQFLQRFYRKSEKELKRLEREAKKKYDEGLREVARLEKEITKGAKRQYSKNKARIIRVEKEAGKRFRFFAATKSSVPGV